MGAKKTVSAKAVVKDLRAGLANSELMEKYGISAQSLYKIFRKLKVARILTDTEVVPRMGQLEATQPLVARKSPRYRPKRGIPISELTDITNEFRITDISESGFKIEGLSCKLGEKKQFVVLADEISDSGSFPVMAECRWVKADSRKDQFEAGYEITEITTWGSEQLRSLIGDIAEEK